MKHMEEKVCDGKIRFEYQGIIFTEKSPKIFTNAFGPPEYFIFFDIDFCSKRRYEKT